MKSKINLTFCLFTLLLLPILTLKAWKEPQQIVELPTAGIIPKNGFYINLEFYHTGGLRSDFAFSPLKDFIVGLSYSGTNIVGTSKLSQIDFQGFPGIYLKYRFFDETINIPAFAIGLSTQGFGSFISSDKRFETHSPGLFFIASKNFRNQFGYFAGHLGVNYSFEPIPKNRALNFFLGIQQEYKDVLAINLEYNATMDEVQGNYLKAKGLLNLMLQIYVYNNFTIGLIEKDLLLHFNHRNSSERKIFIQYISNF